MFILKLLISSRSQPPIQFLVSTPNLNPQSNPQSNSKSQPPISSLPIQFLPANYLRGVLGPKAIDSMFINKRILASWKVWRIHKVPRAEKIIPFLEIASCCTTGNFTDNIFLNLITIKIVLYQIVLLYSYLNKIIERSEHFLFPNFHAFAFFRPEICDQHDSDITYANLKKN